MLNERELPPVPPTAAPHIVDTLIEERAPGFRRHPVLWHWIKKVAYPLLNYNDAVMLADLVADMEAQAIFDYFRERLQLNVDVVGIDHVPREGSAIVVANHPTGIPDGFAFYEALAEVRPDFSFLANRDAIRVAPKLTDMIIPVDWIPERRDTATMREMVRGLRSAVDAGRLIVIFPSGRLSRLTIRGLEEKPWMPTPVGLATRFGLPILPLHMAGRNSALYYLLYYTSQQLMDMSVFREMLNKTGAYYRLAFAEPLDPEDLEGSPEAVARQLQAYVEACFNPALRPGAERGDKGQGEKGQGAVA